MRIGPMLHRVQIQSASDVANAHGGLTRTWTTIDTVAAKVEPLSGTELVEARQVHPRASVRITMRHYPGLTAKHRIILAE